jgi:hypothetical protein
MAGVIDHQRARSSRVAGPCTARYRRAISRSAPSPSGMPGAPPSQLSGRVKRTFWPSDGAKQSRPWNAAGLSSEPQLSPTRSASSGEPERSAIAAVNSSRVSCAPSSAPVTASSTCSSCSGVIPNPRNQPGLR